MPDNDTKQADVDVDLVRAEAQKAAFGHEPDAIDLLLKQHARIQELFLEVAGSTGPARADAFDNLVHLLAIHETAEEEVIHPLARRNADGGDALVDDRLAEEREAKELLVAIIKGGVDADDFDAQLLVLRQAVLEHARHEERYEFTELRARVPADELSALAGTVRTAEALAPTRPHPSAQSATANMVMGAPLAIIDRVRDAIRKPSA